MSLSVYTVSNTGSVSSSASSTPLLAPVSVRNRFPSFTPRVVRRTYGVAQEDVKPIQVATEGPFTIELFRGFEGETHRKIAGRILWTKEPEIPRDRTFYLHIFVDVSGSMLSGLSGSHMSRIKVIQSSICVFCNSLKPLVEKGLKVALSLHTFSTRCNEKVATTEMTMEALEELDWDDHLKTENLTNLWDAVSQAKQMKETTPSRPNEEHTYIILSDGMQTVHETEPIREKVFDYAIGIGTSREYDATILQEISKHDIEGCPDANTLSSTLLRLTCGSYMRQARNVTIQIGTSHLEIKEWMSGSQLLFTDRIPRDQSSLRFTYVIDEPTCGGVSSIELAETWRSRQTRCTQRRVVEALQLQRESLEALDRLKTDYNEDTITHMREQTERMRARFAPSTWVYSVMEGLIQTWKMMNVRMELPLMDRGFSIQSAIRQTSANYYDAQMTRNVATYTQEAL